MRRSVLNWCQQWRIPSTSIFKPQDADRQRCADCNREWLLWIQLCAQTSQVRVDVGLIDAALVEPDPRLPADLETKVGAPQLQGLQEGEGVGNMIIITYYMYTLYSIYIYTMYYTVLWTAGLPLGRGVVVPRVRYEGVALAQAAGLLIFTTWLQEGQIRSALSNYDVYWRVTLYSIVHHIILCHIRS